MHNIMFDWTISIGNILNVCILVGGVLLFFANLKADIRSLRFKIHELAHQQEVLSEAMRQIGSILTQIAVQETRLRNLDKQIDELKHGQGYIKAI